LARESNRVSLLCFVDPLICGGLQDFAPLRGRPDFVYYEALSEQFETRLTDLDDYLGRLDGELDGWRADGVVGLKAALAASIGLAFGDPSIEEARAAFSHKADMTRDQIRVVHDWAFRHILRAAMRNGFPIVIHTGYNAWGTADLRQSNPMHLHNLLIDPCYRELTFVLLHGGTPYIGETTYLAGMFPNVILDFSFLPWYSSPRFRLALGEWLEAVPHDRFCWGADTITPESTVGAAHITRTEIANVLEDCIARGILDEKIALAFLENTYRHTPERVFGLDT